MPRLKRETTEKIDAFMVKEKITQAMLEDWLRDRGMAVVESRDLQSQRETVIDEFGIDYWNDKLDN